MLGAALGTLGGAALGTLGATAEGAGGSVAGPGEDEGTWGRGRGFHHIFTPSCLPKKTILLPIWSFGT